MKEKLTTPKPATRTMFQQVAGYLGASTHDMTQEQFAIDWIEDANDRFNYPAIRGNFSEDDKEKMVQSLSYQVENILEILKPDAKCFQFFKDLNDLLSGEWDKPQPPAIVPAPHHYA